MNKRMIIVFLLGFSSGFPLALVSSTLQAWFVEAGMSLVAIGLLSLLGLPYLFRFIWAPILDRYSLFKLGKRKSWIISMQVVLLFGFNLMAWCAPNVYPNLLVLLALCMAICSATQDVAIDAHRTEYLLKNEQALGVSMAVFGYRLALLFSGGLGLVIAQYLGFAMAYRLLGLVMCCGIIATVYSPEPSEIGHHQPNFAQSFIAPIRELQSRPGIVWLILFIIAYKLGESFTTSTSGIVMPFFIQGLGFSLDTIGYVNNVLGLIAIVIGGMTAGILLMRCSLLHALCVFGLLQALTNVLFVLLAANSKNLSLLALAVFSDNFAAGMGSTGLVALLTRVVDRRYTATQLSVLAAISTIPRNFSGPIAAYIQSCVGWVGLYEFSVVLALVFLPLALLVKPLLEENTVVTDCK
ncbi:MAG: AmpG family muropeptide MFS transporter [Legionella sp.]